MARPYQRPFAVSRPARVGIIRCANVGARRKGAAGPRHDRCDRRHHRQTRRHLSAAARGDRQDRRGDRAAGAEGDRDRSSPGRQGTRRWRCGARESARGESDRAGGGGGIFRTPFSLPRRTTGRWPACRRPTASCCRCRHLPTARKSASPMWRRARPARRCRSRCCSGHATRSNCRFRFVSRLIAIGQKLTIEPDRLLFGDRPIATASDYALPISYYGPRQHHSHRQRRKSDRRPDRQGSHSGPDRRPRRDRDRRRRLLSDAVRFTDAGRGNHFHRDYASGGGGRCRARPAGSHRRGRHDDPASDAAGRFAGVAAKRDRSPDGQRGRAGMGGCEYDCFRARHMARRRDDDRRGCAAGHPVRYVAIMVGPAQRAASRRRRTGCSNNSRRRACSNG